MSATGRGGGTLKRKLSDVVEEVRDSSGTKYCCLANIDADRRCGYAQPKFNSANFKRHILSLHPEVAQRLELVGEDGNREENTARQPRSIARIPVETTRSDVLQGTLRMVTDNYLPIRFPDWQGTKLAMAPLWKACNLKITRNTIPVLIHRSAEIMRGIMSDRLRQTPLCLKIDSASRHSRSVFGINASYTDKNGAVNILHLAAHEMTERQTKENIARVIEEELGVYGLDYKQILVITSDSGTNMLAAVRYLKQIMGDAVDVSLASLLRNEYAMIQSMRTPDTDIADNDAEEIDGNEMDLDDENTSEQSMETLPETDDFNEEQIGTSIVVEQPDDGDFNMDILESVRCGAHMEQLCVWDVLNEYKPRLSNINKICQKMHHKAHRQTFLLHKMPLPPKVCETRWNIWYLLLRYVKELEGSPFLEILKTNDKEIDFSRQWKFIHRFCEALEPMFILSLKAQKEHVPVSQFYADWYVCCAQLDAIHGTGNPLAEKLLAAMNNRDKILRSSVPFLACLYIDPRFNFIGSNRISIAEKSQVKKYLQALSMRLQELTDTDTNAEQDESINQSGSDDLVESYLTSLFEEDGGCLSSPKSNSSNETLLAEIVKLETRPKVPIIAADGQESFNIIDYWKKRKVCSPQMYQLAMALLSIPSTQVTVERLFSQLKLLVSDLRVRLSDTMIKDIMVLKMNESLWPDVIQKLEAELDK